MIDQMAGPGGAGSAGRILRRLLKAGLVIAGMVVAAAVGMYAIFLITIRGHEVIVPDLTRMTPQEAKVEAARRQLEVEVAGERVEPRVPQGRILEQEPPPGGRTRPMRTVKVYVSSGAEFIEVPSFLGQPLRKAQLTLSQLGLRVGSIAHVASFDAPADHVLAQSPKGGARRTKGDAIDLLVSGGGAEKIYVMPALQGLAVDRAKALLGDVGVRVGLTRRQGPPGTGSDVVLEQRPPKGSPLREHETVQLVIAR